MADRAPARPVRPGIARRVRVFAALTLLLACVWIAWAHLAARHVRQINAMRLMGAAMTGGQRDTPGGAALVQSLLNGPRHRPRPPTRPSDEGSTLLRGQTTWVETTVLYWERAMSAVGAGLALAGAAAARPRWARAMHLTGAVLIWLMTAGTLIALASLMAPYPGGLPPLSGWTFVGVGATQAACGAAELAASVRTGGAKNL